MRNVWISKLSSFAKHFNQTKPLLTTLKRMAIIPSNVASLGIIAKYRSSLNDETFGLNARSMTYESYSLCLLVNLFFSALQKLNFKLRQCSPYRLAHQKRSRA